MSAPGAAIDDALSIEAAARAAGGAVGLVVGEREFSYAELAELARERARALQLQAGAGALHALVGHNTLEAVVTLHALLQARMPALLLHPRQTEHEQRATLADAERARATLPPEAAAVIYTSGTTGAPRGAVLTQAALVASARASAAHMGWQAGDRWLLVMPLARIGGLSIVTRCLAARRCVVLAEAFDAARLPQMIERQRVTLASLVPTMLARCLDANPQWRPPAHLRAIQIGGAAASPRLLERASARGLPLVLTYGATETCSQVACTSYEQRHQFAAWGAGLPLPGAELRVVEDRIEVRGPMLMAGYLGEPPRDPAAWFDTGDLGELDAEGRLHVHARRTDLIVTGGENVYPAEVERVLESCPGVAAAAVFGLPDETWGQTVAAALVVEAVRPSDAEIAAHLTERLAPYKRPRRLCFVEALPLTAAGKPDRGALAALAGRMRPLAPGACGAG